MLEFQLRQTSRYDKSIVPNPHVESLLWEALTEGAVARRPQQQMKEATEKRRVLERQHSEAHAQLKEKQQQLNNTATLAKDRKAITDTIDGLQVAQVYVLI